MVETKLLRLSKMVNRLKILHLMPHLGGGVGTVVRGYLGQSSMFDVYQHIVLSLDSINADSKLFLNDHSIEWVENASSDFDLVDAHVANCDLVIIHWWNHPLLQFLLYTHSLPNSRVVIWAHISGSNPPNNFNSFILDYPDRFIFTTPLSFYCPEIQNLTYDEKAKISCIWSTAGVDRLENYWNNSVGLFKEPLKKHSTVGYVGNLDYTKLNSEFLNACTKINPVDTQFVVIGPITKTFESDLKKVHKYSNVKATGYISEEDKFTLMTNFDVFGYPLARHHYGTCDQTIQESMALGIPVVALNNPMESLMVRHGETGIIAANINEYIRAIELILADKKLRDKLSKNCRVFAKNEYSLEKLCLSWDVIFKGVMKNQKSKKTCSEKFLNRNLLPSDVFIGSLGNYAGLFIAHKNAATDQEIKIIESQIKCLQGLDNWSSPTKSTASHYRAFFPQDKWLVKWSDLTKYDMHI